MSQNQPGSPLRPASPQPPLQASDHPRGRERTGEFDQRVWTLFGLLSLLCLLVLSAAGVAYSSSLELNRAMAESLVLTNMRGMAQALKSPLGGLAAYRASQPGDAFARSVQAQLEAAMPDLEGLQVQYIDPDGMLRFSSPASVHQGLFVGDREIDGSRLLDLLKDRRDWQGTLLPAVSVREAVRDSATRLKKSQHPDLVVHSYVASTGGAVVVRFGAQPMDVLAEQLAAPQRRAMYVSVLGALALTLVGLAAWLQSARRSAHFAAEARRLRRMLDDSGES